MKKIERWNMYYDIKRLKAIGLNVSQISQKLNICRNTVYRYLDMDYEEVERLNNQGRKKKLDQHKNYILSWLQSFPNLSSAQVMDWLKERHNEYGVCEATVGNYVRHLRKQHGIPKQGLVRDFEAMEDPPIGYQMQVDLGKYRLYNAHNKLVSLHFIAFLLSYSRNKYVKWQDKPFTTSDLIQAHEDAFEFYQGIPFEAVYDQDRLVVVNENYGEILFTREFATYQVKRDLRIYVCRKSDPQSKGRVEKVVDYVKKNFARHRTFYSIDKLNEECLAWLERTGNGKMHNVTKKIPAQMFLAEKEHLRPLKEKLDIKPFKEIITALVRKDNTVIYKSNRYSLPTGTYDGSEKYLELELQGAELVVLEPDSKKEITRHPLCSQKGKLIKKSCHSRDKNKSIDILMQEVTKLLGGSNEAEEFLVAIRKLRSRYVRDQFQLIKITATGRPLDVILKSLNYCRKNKLFSATCFKDALEYFQKTESQIEKTLQDDINPIEKNTILKLAEKPETRNLDVYQNIADGVVVVK